MTRAKGTVEYSKYLEEASESVETLKQGKELIRQYRITLKDYEKTVQDIQRRAVLMEAQNLKEVYLSDIVEFLEADEVDGAIVQKQRSMTRAEFCDYLTEAMNIMKKSIEELERSNEMSQETITISRMNHTVMKKVLDSLPTDVAH